MAINNGIPRERKAAPVRKRNRFPSGWSEERVKRVLQHYEGQTQEESATEDEAAFRQRGRTVMVVPSKLVPAITKLIERRASKLRKTEPPGAH